MFVFAFFQQKYLHINSQDSLIVESSIFNSIIVSFLESVDEVDTGKNDHVMRLNEFANKVFQWFCVTGLSVKISIIEVVLYKK